jgi:hypothetical protein
VRPSVSKTDKIIKTPKSLWRVVDKALDNTLKAQAEVSEKRERIFENRRVIMGIRKDIELFTDE